jgi:hypothetical protein
MARRNVDPAYDPDEIENEDPLGEEAFAEGGFADAPGGGPDFNAPGLEDDAADRQPGGRGQKVAGIPEAEQHEVNTPSEQRPDSGSAIIRERGGATKGDPAVGGTRST